MVETSFSIIIPTWNCASYICNCLDSILNQSCQNIEVIIIDDASTDATSVILKYYLKKDSRIILHTNSCNQGIGICRNIGLDRACGEYVLFIEYYREEMLTYVEYLSFEQFLFGFTSLDKKQMERIKERYVERIRKVEID